MHYFNDIHEKLKVKSDSLIGKEVYMSVNNSALSVDDLVLVTIEEILTREDRDENGLMIRGKERRINEDIEEEFIYHEGRAIYQVIGENKVMTSNGPRMVVAGCDDFGPFLEMIKKEEAIGRYFINAVFRYKGIFFYFKITGNYLFGSEEAAIDYINALDVLHADLTERGMIVNVFGDNFLVEKYDISVQKIIYKDKTNKRLTYDAIYHDLSEKEKNIELTFKRYVIKYY
jgi:hypothetical protein